MTDTTTEQRATSQERPLADRDPGARLSAQRVRLEPFDVEVGPLGHLAQERARLAALEWQHFDVRRLGATIGAEISGVDLGAELDQAVVDELAAALAAYKVLFFRRQPLSPERHVAFAQRFGALEVHPFIPANTSQPELVRFEKEAQVGGYENGWHSDVSWRQCPSMGAVLHALEVPPVGGDTLFADMTAAYEGLDDELARRVEHMVAIHDYVKAFGHQVDGDTAAKMRATYPPVEHPVVRTHPVTGRKALFVAGDFMALSLIHI